MPFYFLKYLQPTHYFRLFSNRGESVYPKVELLPSTVLKQLDLDSNYTSQMASDYDLSWQAVQSGYIGTADTYLSFNTLGLNDNYHFIRKNFHPAWVFYVLLIRILTFNNAFKEFRAWSRTSHINRQKKIQPITYSKWKHFKSELLGRQPFVTVVIPTLNRYNYLKNVLEDFEKQDYKHFEIIVVDQSDSFNRKFYEGFHLNLQVVRQEEKALWLARNSAIKNSKGQLIALSEDDVRINADWISTHIKCLDFFKADVSAGVFYPEGKHIPFERSFFAKASQFATGNAMLYKSVFETVGLFDRQFEKQRMGDGEFGLRVYLQGLKSISNPFAFCVDVKAGTGGLREMGSWDAFRPSTFFAPRPIPSVLYYYRKYFGNQAARFALLRTIPISVLPYQFKKNKLFLVLGVILTFILMPLVLFQVFKSWYLSTEKLKEGAIIERI